MTGAPLPGVLGAIAPLLDRYGYLAVFGLIGVESFGVPAPGQTILIAAAVYAGAGHLNIALVALTAFLASVIGDNIGFLIGHQGGRRLVVRYGRHVGLTDQRMASVEDTFTRHGGKLVVVARFVDGLRQFNGLVCGVAGMGWWRFLACNAIGAALWVAVWESLGLFAGRHLNTVYEQIQRYQLLFVGLLAVVFVGLVVRHVMHRRREDGEKRDGDEADGARDGGEKRDGDSEADGDGARDGDEAEAGRTQAG